MDNFKDFIEDIRDISKKYVIISGVTDIIDGFINNPSYYLLLGNATDDYIKDCMSYMYLKDEKIDGEYEFDMVFKWVASEYDSLGRLTQDSYIEEYYWEFNLIQTIKQRDRQKKIEDIYDIDFLFSK